MWLRGVEISKYKPMLVSLIQSELRTRYKGSVLGFMWTFITPVLMLIVYNVIFSSVMKVNIPNYAVFLFIGLLAWNLFASATLSSASVIIRQDSLVKKIYFPREILPLSVVGGSVVNYLLSLLILIPFLLVKGYEPSPLWLYIPVIVCVEAVFTCGLALLFATINVFIRDFEHMLNILLMLWFYFTPVLYNLSMVPKGYAALFQLNPLTNIITSYQDVLYNRIQPNFTYGAISSIVILLVGWGVFGYYSRRFAEEV